MDGRVVTGPSEGVWHGFGPGPVYALDGGRGSVALAAQTLARWLGRATADLPVVHDKGLVHAAAAAALERPATCGCGNPLCGNPLADASCPLLLVPGCLPESWPGDGPILAPLDGSDDARIGAAVAADLAAHARRGLAVVHVAEPGNPPRGPLAVPRLVDQAHHEWPAWRHAFMSRQCQCGDRQTSLVVRAGSPVSQILKVAGERSAAVIVLAWHGDASLGRGATLAGVVAGADRPVLLVRTPRAG